MADCQTTLVIEWPIIPNYIETTKKTLWWVLSIKAWNVILLWNANATEPMTWKWMMSYTSNKSPTCLSCLWDTPAGLLLDISPKVVDEMVYVYIGQNTWESVTWVSVWLYFCVDNQLQIFNDTFYLSGLATKYGRPTSMNVSKICMIPCHFLVYFLIWPTLLHVI